MVDAESPTRDEWTPDERRRLDALAQERSSGAELEARTMAALRGHGLLAGGPRAAGPLAGAGPPRARRTLMLAMAASAVFAAGVGAGYLAAMRTVAAKDAARESPANSGAAGAAGAAATAGAANAGARSETLAARTNGGRQVTWY